MRGRRAHVGGNGREAAARASAVPGVTREAGAVARQDKKPAFSASGSAPGPFTPGVPVTSLPTAGGIARGTRAGTPSRRPNPAGAAAPYR
ncbi:hypothetical protein ACWDOG_34600, partial [Streptomyces fungicidicus]